MGVACGWLMGRNRFLSPVTSKPASRGRIKTGYSEVLDSYQVSGGKQGDFNLLRGQFTRYRHFVPFCVSLSSWA